jgi:hypothetical protein
MVGKREISATQHQLFEAAIGSILALPASAELTSSAAALGSIRMERKSAVSA